MNPRSPVFVDSVFLIALIVPGDQWREAALAAAPVAGGRHLYTSDGIFQELLAHVARDRDDVRARATALVRRMQLDLAVTVVEHTREMVDAALDLYDGEFRYSRLSLQDCIAIQIMRRVGITEILSADQEFTLAGFTPLLRRYA